MAEEISKEAVLKAIRQLYIHFNSNGDHFTSKLFDLIAKADIFNKQRLSQGFPAEVMAYNLWMSFPGDSETFFKSYGIESASNVS